MGFADNQGKLIPGSIWSGGIPVDQIKHFPQLDKFMTLMKENGNGSLKRREVIKRAKQKIKSKLFDLIL